jgi:DNA polymerase I - 3''-5'' exonuclease and polymerase domains
MASISGDKALVESFQNNEDIHAKTASEIFKVNPEGVDPAMRRKAKVINFGIIYGMSPFGLSKELGISADEAKLYIDLYFKNHPAIKDYMDITVEEAKIERVCQDRFWKEMLCGKY